MCTIILGVRIEDDELPWTIAANRDERLDRPSAPPRVIEDGGRRILMPQDLVYGGTWIGMNDRGLLVALTNRDASEGNLPVPPSTPLPPTRPFVSDLRTAASKALRPPRLTSDSLWDRQRSAHGSLRSRGLLVRDALRLQYADDVATLAHGTAAQYKPFHLVAVDHSGDARLVVHSDGDTHRERLDRGWHVITEQSFGAGSDRRGAYLRERLAAHPHTTRGYPVDMAAMPELLGLRVPAASVGVPTLARLLGTHLPGDPFDGPCVHTVHRGNQYGTRSFFAAEFDPWMHDVLPEGLLWWHHEGPTCTLVPSTMGYGTMFGADPSCEIPPPPAPPLQAGEGAPGGKGRKTEEGGTP